jgi:hypothetical protein
MSGLDHRKPSVVTDEFRARIARDLVPRGFAVRARGASLVRKRGKNTHRIDFSSSHKNAEGYVVCWVGPFFEDAAVRKTEKGWRAGGLLTGPAFAEEGSTNVAVPADADALAERIVQHLAFFDLLEDPARVLVEVRRRYVPGLVAPVVVVPYLRARLGAGAVSEYASALLAARPELWPAFASTRAGSAATTHGVALADHGTQLAMVITAAEESALKVPADVVTSNQPPARSLRCFFGRQLRAWGEPAAAAELRSVGDEDILRARAAQDALGEPIVDSVAAARLVLHLAAREDRLPARPAPSPRLFQYHVLHEPFEAA